MVEGKVLDEIEYLTMPTWKSRYLVAQANSEMDEKGNAGWSCDLSPTGRGGRSCEGKEVDYMDVSPKQLVSVAAG